MTSETNSIQPAVLLTIITETVMTDRIAKLLKNHNVSGYTLTQAQGEGGHGRRMGDIAGYKTNVEIKTIVSLEISDKIFADLMEYRSNHALIAFRNQVDVLMD